MALLLLLVAVNRSRAQEESTTPTQPSAATTLGTLFRQARSERYYPNGGSSANGYGEDTLAASRVDAYEGRDAGYYDPRCITCDPNKMPATAAASIPETRDPYRRYRTRPKYDSYEDDQYGTTEDRRYRDQYRDQYREQYDPYYDRARTPNYDYRQYDPYAKGNELFRPSTYNDQRYDPYQRDPYYRDRPLMDRPINRPLMERPRDRPTERPYERPWDSNYDRNNYDNYDPAYPYPDDEYERYNPQRRPPYEEYGPPKYNRGGSNRGYGRYDTRYDRYDPYDRSMGRRPLNYDDRYDSRYGGSRGQGYDQPRGYYGGGGGGWSAGGGVDRPAYASAWNYAGGNRDNWRDVNRDRDRDRDRERDRDRDYVYYGPKNYYYDSTAAPGGSRGTSYYDRPESSTKSDTDREKPTNAPQTQDSKNYKE